MTHIAELLKRRNDPPPEVTVRDLHRAERQYVAIGEHPNRLEVYRRIGKRFRQEMDCSYPACTKWIRFDWVSEPRTMTAAAVVDQYGIDVTGPTADGRRMLVMEIDLDDVPHIGIGLSDNHLPLYIRDGGYGYCMAGASWPSVDHHRPGSVTRCGKAEVLDAESIQRRYGYLLDDQPRPPYPRSRVVLPLIRPPGS